MLIRLALAMTFAAALPLCAETLATGAEIKAAVAGNTLEGYVTDADPFTEFCAEDGTIRSDSDTGTWKVDGDRLCVAYGTPETACWAIKIDGETITYKKGGKDDGSATILKGKPENF